MSLQHYDENISVHFSDSLSNKEEFIEAQFYVESLLRLAPCNSYCNLQIQGKRSSLKGYLELKTPDKIFSFEAQSSTFEELKNILFNSVKRQLSQWKKSRSVEDITGSTKLQSF